MADGSTSCSPCVALLCRREAWTGSNHQFCCKPQVQPSAAAYFTATGQPAAHVDKLEWTIALVGCTPSADPFRSVAVPRLRLAWRRSVPAPMPGKMHPSCLYSPSCSPLNLPAPAAAVPMALRAPSRAGRRAKDCTLGFVQQPESVTCLDSSSSNVVQPFGKLPSRQRHRVVVKRGPKPEILGSAESQLVAAVQQHH